MKQDEEKTIRIPADLYYDCVELQNLMARFHKGYEPISIDWFIAHAIKANTEHLRAQYAIASHVADTGELPAHMKLPNKQ
jgi:hypothetical protein